MQMKTFLRPALLVSAVMVLLMVFAACATAAEPQIVEKEVIVEREVIKEVPVEKEVVVEVEKEVVVEKEVPVEIERIKEVPVEVEKIVEKEVVVEREVVKEVLVNPPPLAMPGKGVEVRPGRADWNTGYFQEALYSLALEELGYDVQDHQELGPPLFYNAVAQGDLDFWANAWFPLHTQFEATWSQGAEIAGTVIPSGGVQGYLVDKASVEKLRNYDAGRLRQTGGQRGVRP